MYNFKEIESKWQKKWDEEKPYKAIDFHPTKPKYYVLYEFYNISGNLHMGHLKGTVPADALARYKRFCGYNVLFPIGGDAFGLPAENAAIKTSIKPKDFVKEGMKNAMETSKKLGFSFDYDRTICTSDPEYYKWTQWIFKKLFDYGKAYKKEGIVNFCPTCKTVLSNEDSQNGECDRCHGKVIQESRSVWFLKMREYSEKLLKNIDNIKMAENLKELQRNWIGKSEGVEVSFKILNESKKIGNINIYTTCIETIFGVTFIAIAPENKIITEYKEYIENIDEINSYCEQAKYKTELDRLSNQKDKTGCIVKGITAINPINNTEIPVYISDFVISSSGTGAIMGVPSHDERDYDFAKKFNIPIIKVISINEEKNVISKNDYINKGIMVNSGDFTGMKVSEAKTKITEYIIKNKIGTKQTNYKMQDWSFNRQRYWGEPFPMVNCPQCGWISLNEEDLPLTLPDTNDYMPDDSGNSPIAKIEKWVNCKCPKCGADAKREIDTMPNWAGSSWYWLRYTDPHNDKALADYEKLKYWGSVDCYTGGTEHITRHVLYAFFWQNFLYEIGVLPTREAFIRKMGSGLILDSEGKKMSKSSANGVTLTEVVDEYGADISRLHTHFMSAYEDNVKWTFDGINGIISFVNKVWKLMDIVIDGKVSDKHKYEINELIKKAEESYESLTMNTLIAAFMIFVNKMRKDGYITKEELRIFMIILNPIAPHITSEIYERVFNKDIMTDTWPQYESLVKKDDYKIPVQINGKTRRVIEVNHDASQEELISIVKEKYPDIITGEIKKVIYIKNKIINIVI